MYSGTETRTTAVGKPSNGTTFNQPAPTQRVGQIEMITAQINREVADLHEVITQLEYRLSPAIPDVPLPDSKGGECAQGETLAPRAAQLLDSSQGIVAAQRRLRELLNRVEL